MVLTFHECTKSNRYNGVDLICQSNDGLSLIMKRLSFNSNEKRFVFPSNHSKSSIIWKNSA